MQIIGDVTVSLPYALDFCAKGPDVEPISLSLDGVEIVLYFPPSMSEGTIGQSFFSSGWAWWTGTTLRITTTVSVSSNETEVDEIRSLLLQSANNVLHRFLNSYRLQFHKSQVYPVLIDEKEFQLTLLQDDGTSSALPEPETAFFYHKIPTDAPLQTSVNSTTLDLLRDSLIAHSEPDVQSQLRLDAEWFELLGNPSKADLLRNLLDSNH
jgi:hypothetical protein